jgi:hypothetical protein
MISSKVAKRSSVLISTVFSLFCIGCSQNSLDGLTQVSSKIQDTKSGLTLDVKAVEEQFEEIQAPKDLNPINNQASSVENKEKRPCPPPPPPCGEKKIAEGDTKLEQNQSQPNNVGDVAV